MSLPEKYRPAGKRVRNAIQTNDTLLMEKWARFLSRHNFLVGPSIDGPPVLHDRHRRDRRGGPSSTPVIAAFELLRAHDAEFNVLKIVNRDNSRRPLEVYRFLRDIGVTFMQFIPVVERANADGRLAGPPRGRPDGEDQRVTPWSVRPDHYGRFLCAISTSGYDTTWGGSSSNSSTCNSACGWVDQQRCAFSPKPAAGASRRAQWRRLRLRPLRLSRASLGQCHGAGDRRHGRRPWATPFRRGVDFH